MPKTVAIIPGVNQTRGLYYANCVAIRTFAAFSGKDCQLYFVDHDSKRDIYSPSASEQLKKQCDDFGVIYLYWKDPFSISGYFNRFEKETDSEFIVYGSSDVIFYPNWLENILSAWRKYPNLHSMHPVSYSDILKGLEYIENGNLEDEVKMSNAWLSLHCGVFRRSEKWVWSEALPFRHLDLDYIYWLRSHDRHGGIVRNSRVDHMLSFVQNTANRDWITSAHFDDADKKISEIWPIVPQPTTYKST